MIGLRLFAICAFVLLAACGRQKELAPDYAFNFRCKGAAYPASEAAIETFLTSHGFTAFDEERVRRQYRLTMYPLAIDGVDKRRRMLDFRGINEKTTDEPVPKATVYSVGLYSPPPTRHDAVLEQAMLAFVQNGLKCEVSQVSRYTNGAEVLSFFNKVYAAEQKRIAEGRKCDRARAKPLDTHCPS